MLNYSFLAISSMWFIEFALILYWLFIIEELKVVYSLDVAIDSLWRDSVSLSLLSKKTIGEDGTEKRDIDYIQFNIDLVLYDSLNSMPHCVFDTKYKRSEYPDSADIEQIVAYAEMKGCHEAVLIYPQRSIEQFDEKLGSVRIRSLAFPIDDNLDSAGQYFMQTYFSGIIDWN